MKHDEYCITKFHPLGETKRYILLWISRAHRVVVATVLKTERAVLHNKSRGLRLQSCLSLILCVNALSKVLGKASIVGVNGA